MKNSKKNEKTAPVELSRKRRDKAENAIMSGHYDIMVTFYELFEKATGHRYSGWNRCGAEPVLSAEKVSKKGKVLEEVEFHPSMMAEVFNIDVDDAKILENLISADMLISDARVHMHREG